jgi:agmatinase
MEVVEVSPPYDVSEMTALLATRVVVDVLASLVDAGKLPRQRPTWLNTDSAQEPWAL